jgi:hypothetical protein
LHDYDNKYLGHYNTRHEKNSCKFISDSPEGLLEKPKCRWQENKKWVLKNYLKMWAAFIWLRIGPSGEIL